MKTICLLTLGCKVNQYETQAIGEQFNRLGLQEVGSRERADIYVINTCTVTLSADRKSRQLIRAAHRKNPAALIVVTGCYTEMNSAEIKKIAGVNLILNNSQKPILGRIVQEQLFLQPPAIVKDQPPDSLSINNFKDHTRAFVKIQDGCNNNCSYCKVRIVRGRSRSRRLEDIISEINRLARAGFKEIVLVGIHLGAYGSDFKKRTNLIGLIEPIENIAGIEQLRLSSIDPLDLTPALIKKIGISKKICPHLHVALQNGDDYILRKMNRCYRVKDIKKLVRNIRRHIKDVAITLDIMVGFPGEKESNFTNTLGLLKEIKPARIHIFPYSKRPGTLAAGFKNVVSPQEVRERYQRLREFAVKSSFIYRSQFINRKVKVLVETKRDPKTALLCGYSQNYIRVLFEGRDGLKNSILPVKIVDVTIDKTIGKVV